MRNTLFSFPGRRVLFRVQVFPPASRSFCHDEDAKKGVFGVVCQGGHACAAPSPIIRVYTVIAWLAKWNEMKCLVRRSWALRCTAKYLVVYYGVHIDGL